MATLVNDAFELYDNISQLIDPRVKTLPLARLSHMFILIILYLTFVYKWGPRFMKNRQPFQIDGIVMVYNALQVVACATVTYLALRTWIGEEYKLFCQPVNRSDTPEAWNGILLTYYYYLLKVADLFDTVFFVFRKKESHITFLHVYHHAGMIGLIGGAVNFIPAGHGGSIGIINSIVHCVMYFYYFLTIYNPDYKANIWWKKYVTQLQILQFILFIVHIGSVLVIPGCEYPKFAAIVFLPQNVFMLIMFTDFYIKTYVKKNRTRDGEKQLKHAEETDVGKVEGIVLKSRNGLNLRNGHR